MHPEKRFVPVDTEQESSEWDLLAAVLDAEVRLAREQAGSADEQDMSWLPEWYLGRMAGIEARRAKIKEQYKAMLRQCDMEAAGVARWWPDFRRQVLADIAADGGKRKTKDYFNGRAGTRAGREGLDVVDEDAALDWALDHCPEAVDPRLARTTPLLEHYQRTQETPPGCVYREKRDQFFPKQVVSEEWGVGVDES